MTLILIIALGCQKQHAPPPITVNLSKYNNQCTNGAKFTVLSGSYQGSGCSTQKWVNPTPKLKKFKKKSIILITPRYKNELLIHLEVVYCSTQKKSPNQ